MSRYKKIGRGRVNGQACSVAIDRYWDGVADTIFSFLILGNPQHFTALINGRECIHSSIGFRFIGELLSQGIIDEDAYKAAAAAHMERIL